MRCRLVSLGLMSIAASLATSQIQASPYAVSPLHQAEFRDGTSAMPEGEVVLAPLSFVRFCLRRPAECARTEQAEASTPPMSPLMELASVNRAVNRAIRPRHKALVNGLGDWTIAPAAGDCNDFAVTKRHELLKRGWAMSSLLLSVVETAWGEGHLVLIVRTDEDDLVLDNLTAEIRPWRETHYRWIKRQSATDPTNWVSLDDRVTRVTVASADQIGFWRLRRGS